jgi:hypothetical protein
MNLEVSDDKPELFEADVVSWSTSSTPKLLLEHIHVTCRLHSV